MILFLLFEVDYLFIGVPESTTLFPQFFPDEFDLLILLLPELLQFFFLEVLEAPKVALPGMLKLQYFLMVGFFY